MAKKEVEQPTTKASNITVVDIMPGVCLYTVAKNTTNAVENNTHTGAAITPIVSMDNYTMLSNTYLKVVGKNKPASKNGQNDSDAQVISDIVISNSQTNGNAIKIPMKDNKPKPENTQDGSDYKGNPKNKNNLISSGNPKKFPLKDYNSKPEADKVCKRTYQTTGTQVSMKKDKIKPNTIKNIVKDKPASKNGQNNSDVQIISDIVISNSQNNGNAIKIPMKDNKPKPENTQDKSDYKGNPKNENNLISNAELVKMPMYEDKPISAKKQYSGDDGGFGKTATNNISIQEKYPAKIIAKEPKKMSENLPKPPKGEGKRRAGKDYSMQVNPVKTNVKENKKSGKAQSATNRMEKTLEKADSAPEVQENKKFKSNQDAQIVETKNDDMDELNLMSKIQNMIVKIGNKNYIKHPLKYQWTWWYLTQNAERNWKDNQKDLGNFGTVEDFWSLFDFIPGGVNLKFGDDYSVFKKGIRPMWEDAGNAKGGRWIIDLNRSEINKVNEYWRNLLLAMIGGAFEQYDDEICGAVINNRSRGFRISLWTANGDKKAVIQNIGEMLMEEMDFGKNKLRYALHVENKTAGGGEIKTKFSLEDGKGNESYLEDHSGFIKVERKRKPSSRRSSGWARRK